MANVSMKAPSGFAGSISCNVSTPPSSGASYTPDVNGMVLVDTRDTLYLLQQGFTFADERTAALIGTADNGTTQTLTAAMISGGNTTYHVSTGGATPSLTLPLATDYLAANPGLDIGESVVLRVINSNSGTATVVTNTGWTTSGTLTLATNTWREFLITKTAAATATIASIGTGTNS